MGSLVKVSFKGRKRCSGVLIDLLFGQGCGGHHCVYSAVLDFLNYLGFVPEQHQLRFGKILLGCRGRGCSQFGRNGDLFVV